MKLPRFVMFRDSQFHSFSAPFFSIFILLLLLLFVISPRTVLSLLQYNKFVFSLGLGIQPYTLTVNPHLPINVDMPSKSMFPNLFWFFFCPFVTYHFTPLPVVHRQDKETPEQFAKRVQKMTADALGIACTTYSYKDKVSIVLLIPLRSPLSSFLFLNSQNRMKRVVI